MTLCLAICSAVIAVAFMSTANAESVRVAVPFGFKAGAATLPPGTYQVEVSPSKQQIHVAQVNGKAGCFLTIKDFAGKATTERGSLVFNRYGSTYFLTRVNPANADAGVELYMSKAEREIAKAEPVTHPAMVVASGR